MINFEELLKKPLKPNPPKSFITFDFYLDYLTEDDDKPPKFLFSLDWCIIEDSWRQRYMFDRPKYNPEEMEVHRINNENRCQYFRINMKICSLSLYLDLKLKKVGNIVRGRLIDEEVKVKEWQERKAKRAGRMPLKKEDK